MAPSAQDDEFVVPPAPAKGNKHMRSRSRGRALSDQQRRKQVTARTSLEDTIENLVDLPLSEELMSTRARADLQLQRKHARELRPMSSRNSMNSLKDNPESLGQATPGLQAYQRPSSSCSSQNGFPFDQQQPYDFTAADPSPSVTDYQSPRRPSTSSVNSNHNRSRIPVPANALSRSLPSSANGDSYFDTPDQPRSVSAKAHPAYDDENAAPHQSKPPPRSSSVKRSHNPQGNDAGAERPLKRHESVSRSETFPQRQQQQQTSSSLTQQHKTPQQGNERPAGSQSVPAKRQPAANGKGKDQPLGPKRAPNAANREPRATPSTPTQQPRARAVTGNAGARRPPANAIKTPPNPRKRAASAVGRDTTTPPRDRVQPDAPFVNDMSPIVYRSDHINKSKTSDSLAAMANNKRREQEGASSLDQARSWDDVVIPTVARQLHAQERLEAAIAADEAEREKAAASKKNGSPQRQSSQHGSVRNRKQSSNSETKEASAPNPPEKEDENSNEVEQLQPRPPEDTLLPSAPQRRPSVGSQQLPPRLNTGNNGRKEIWEMPELASPGIAKETMQRKKSGGKMKQRPAYPKEGVPSAKEEDHGGGCCKCIIC